MFDDRENGVDPHIQREIDDYFNDHVLDAFKDQSLDETRPLMDMYFIDRKGTRRPEQGVVRLKGGDLVLSIVDPTCVELDSVLGRFAIQFGQETMGDDTGDGAFGIHYLRNYIHLEAIRHAPAISFIMGVNGSFEVRDTRVGSIHGKIDRHRPYPNEFKKLKLALAGDKIDEFDPDTTEIGRYEAAFIERVSKAVAGLLRESPLRLRELKRFHRPIRSKWDFINLSNIAHHARHEYGILLRENGKISPTEADMLERTVLCLGGDDDFTETEGADLLEYWDFRSRGGTRSTLSILLSDVFNTGTVST